MGRLSVSLLATKRSAAMEEFVPVAARIRAAKIPWRRSIAIALHKAADLRNRREVAESGRRPSCWLEEGVLAKCRLSWN